MAQRIAKMGQPGAGYNSRRDSFLARDYARDKGCMTLENGCVVLEVVSEALVESTRGMLKGGPSLSAALQQQRRRDIKRDSKVQA